MDGFLSENKMKDLLLAGFDINKFYSDCYYEKHFFIVEKTRPLTEAEKQEMIDDGDGEFVDTACVLENEEILYIKIGEKVNLPLNMSGYDTLSIDDLIYYLKKYFTCDYKIFCDYLNDTYFYDKIEYKENGKINTFQLKPKYSNISFEILLCSFIIFLLTEKKYLLKI